jgi:hypothetical protein
MGPGNGAGDLPDVADPSVAMVSLEGRDVGDETEQRSVADAVVAGWAKDPWPEHLRSVSCFTSVDPVVGVGFLRGTEATDDARLRVVTYAQWTSMPADNLLTFARYRSFQPVAPGTAPRTGCVFFVTIDFDGPDRRRQRRWIEGVVAALAAEPEPAPGLIAAHFHASTDGTRVVNYAEWISAQAHRDALTHGPNGVGQTELPEWRRVREFPGVTGNTVGRYTLHRSLTAETGPA